MNRSRAMGIAEFFSVYRQYRSGGHTRATAARIAFGIAFQRLPF